MARIPAEELERLKAEVPVEGLIGRAGIELKAAGKDRLGRCPFHDDREASLVVTPAKNLWHCFGCQTGGGPIDWVMKWQGVSFRHAVEILRAGELTLAARPLKRGPRVLAPALALSASDQALLDETVGYYHERLQASPEALAYLASRGLDDAELIARFRLGVADRSLGLRLPEKSRKAGEEIRRRLQRLGLLRDSGHEHFNGSLVIPVLDAAGHVTEVYGRKLNEHLRPGTPKHLYLPGPHKGVWNAAGLAGQAEVILCEALIDALTFWRAGFHHVTASYGVEGFTAEHLAAFQRAGTRRVLIAYDRDEAGERAAARLAPELCAAGLEVLRIEFPKGMDANEYALKVTPAAKSLGLVIRKAVWLGKGPVGESTSNAVSSSLSLAAPAASVPAVASTAAPTVSAAPTAPTGEDWVVTYGERRYRVRGLGKNLSPATLKINLLVAQAEAYYVDTVDLYSARQRQQYGASAATELGVGEALLKADLGRLLLALEAEQQARIAAATAVEPAVPAMSEAEREAALALLRDPQLLTRISADAEACGIVGERTNTLVGYLAAVSRKLERPLAVLIQSSSAAGKSSLMDALLAFVPAEERLKYSALTGQSLFYLGETNLQHKILAIVEEEGASRASYALKLLQSEGELTIASTGKDPQTGHLVTQQYRVAGPVMILLTTTAITLDEELLNRCLVLSVDEGREQTEAIHRRQRARRTLAGLAAGQAKARLLRDHQNAQRLLRTLPVVNPYAEQLTFLSDQTRTRRDHEKYLTLIDALALLHQYQRPIKTTPGPDGAPLEYVEATLDDIVQANVLAHEVLGRALDELPPQTRRVLARLCAWVQERCTAERVARADYRFSRRALREATGLADTQLRVHLARLVELEYLLVHRGQRGQSFVYELLFDGSAASEAPHLSGLLDVTAMRSSRGASPALAASTRAQRGPNAVGERVVATGLNPGTDAALGAVHRARPATARPAAPAAEIRTVAAGGR